MERDDISFDVTTAHTISTHTLTWSVTKKLNTYYRLKGDFNSHAHVERDREKIKKIAPVDNFNSHAHVERDTVRIAGEKVLKISTHTLTWSVTILF